MKLSRRNALVSMVLGGGAGWLGLRALATGVPAAFLANPRRAHARHMSGATQRLILISSSKGHAFNANVPGTYGSPRIVHPDDPRMAATALTIAGQAHTAAAPWATLPQSVLDRSCFFHHATLTNSHANLAKVLKLQGDVDGQEMAVSMFARELATSLGPVQVAPVSLASNKLSFEGRTLPAIPPTGLRAALARPTSPLTRLAELRAAQLDKLNQQLKTDGTPAQRRFLDRVANTRREANDLGQDLLQQLSTIASNDSDGQVLAAVVLMQMNVSPVVAISISFSNDNHGDPGLVEEADATVSGLATMNTLFRQLTAAGLQDQVTVAYIDVFGRTLEKKGQLGRDHNGAHHVMYMCGAGVRGGVIGGIEPFGRDWGARDIDSRTGAGVDGGDVPHLESLAAMGKTLGAALGLDRDVLDRQIRRGRVVEAALA